MYVCMWVRSVFFEIPLDKRKQEKILYCGCLVQEGFFDLFTIS